MNQRESFVGGAMALLVSGVIVKVLGALFKIPLTNLIGDSGMGQFAFAMQFFSLLFVVTASGLPVAEAQLVSESLALGARRRAQAVVVQAAAVFGVIALLCSAALAALAPYLCRMFGESDQTAWGLIAVAPAVFFVTIEAALRGWYQGTGNMIPTAVSQVAEATGKLAVGLFLAKKLLDYGYGTTGAAVGGILGITFGELLAMTYMLWSARHGIRTALHRGRDSQNALPQLFQLMIPVTLGAAVMTVSGFLDMAVIYRRLPAAGFSGAEIVAMYGAYTGMVMTLFNLPQALSNSVSVSVLPALSAAHARGNSRQMRRLITSSMRLTLLVCLPCGAGLFTLAQPLLHVLFSSQPHGVQTAEPLLRLMALAEPVVGLATVSTAVLQSFGRPDLTVCSMAAGCTAKFAVSFSLAAQPQYNISAAPISSLVCYSTILLLNLIGIFRLTGWFPPLFRAFFRPFLAACGSAFAAQSICTGLQQIIHPAAAAAAGVCAAVPAYVLLLLVLHALEASDVSPLPGGTKLVQMLRLNPESI